MGCTKSQLTQGSVLYEEQYVRDIKSIKEHSSYIVKNNLDKDSLIGVKINIIHSDLYKVDSTIVYFFESNKLDDWFSIIERLPENYVDKHQALMFLQYCRLLIKTRLK